MAANPITRYSRLDGPLCYELRSLTLPGASLLPTLKWLINSDLALIWEQFSDDSELDVGMSSLRLLGEDNVNEFIAFSEPALETDDQSIGMHGVKRTGCLELLNKDRFAAAVRAFAKDESGPIEVMFCQVGDQLYDYVFGPHDPAPTVSKLMYELGVTSDARIRDLPYRALRLASLEKMYSL